MNESHNFKRPKKTMTPLKRIGVAADHSGYALKERIAERLKEAGYEVVHFGDGQSSPEDDYPDFIAPLARAVANGQVDRGVALCGSGVGACITANKVPGVRACLISDSFSAHQGVEDDDLNVICLGGLVIGDALAWELVNTFVNARFIGGEQHKRRLSKIAALENISLTDKTIIDSSSADEEKMREPHNLTVSEALEVWRNEGDPN